MSQFNVRNAGWSDAALAWLDTNWIADELTTQEMGRVLGCSKHAVIGKAHRRKLPGKLSPVKRALPVPHVNGAPGEPRWISYSFPPGCEPRATPARKTRAAGDKKPRAKKPATNHKATPEAKQAWIEAMRAKLREAQRPQPAAPPPPKKVYWSTAQLAPRDGCCWPLGDPGAHDFRFCGAAQQEKSPYCTEHHTRAYVKRPGGTML